jgi:hypothetical protein
MTLLLVWLAGICMGAGAVGVAGQMTARRRDRSDRLEKSERQELRVSRGTLREIDRLSRQHAATEPFAAIVADEIDKHERKVQR